ncbi:LysR family transcriptional regulator [Aliidongia dinghuensis]|uniref:LysR family transcriptional regulator n=1 Tax=Aliidongia dinghuensis TaxID=1867774 RepID=A0A8J2YZR5_9PROT|nr:LysR family transcriptional regulator [Aliidongia dinghuensis]GGF46972.1 LysR family transcriptional regulator [Aliidongia dinghuensis]
MSITLKQVEALYWIATLGSVVEAAERLNLAQSTISKRILELETVLNVQLLDRSGRAVALTRSGQNLLPIATELLKLGTRFHEVAAGPLGFSGSFRFGVTELVALTWLPKLVVAMKEAFPDVVPEPEVDASISLYDKLADRRLDLVIGLDPPAGSGFKVLPLDSVTLQWMCAPGAGPDADELPLAEIANYPILTQGEGSGLQRLVVEWLNASGITFNRIVKCNSLSVLSALAMAGLGATFLTEQYFTPEIQSGRLRIIRTKPKLPPIQYFASFRADALDPLAELIAKLSQNCCDFSLRRT